MYVGAGSSPFMNQYPSYILSNSLLMKSTCSSLYTGDPSSSNSRSLNMSGISIRLNFCLPFFTECILDFAGTSGVLYVIPYTWCSCTIIICYSVSDLSDLFVNLATLLYRSTPVPVSENIFLASPVFFATKSTKPRFINLFTIL